MSYLQPVGVGRRVRSTLPWLLAALVVTAIVAVPRAEARPRPKASSFQANKEFGIGLMVGAPTAIAGKYYLSSDTAIDGGIGVIRGFGRRDGLHLHADFLWHPAVLASADPFLLGLYMGIGGRVFDFDYDDNSDLRGEDDLGVGVRVPIGLMLDFNNVPIDVFFELALVVDFLVDAGDADADFNGALGVRYYF